MITCLNLRPAHLAIRYLLWHLGKYRNWPIVLNLHKHIGSTVTVQTKSSSDAKIWNPREQSTWGQHGAHLGPFGPRWAPCWPHEPCYQGSSAACWERNIPGWYDKYQSCWCLDSWWLHIYYIKSHGFALARTIMITPLLDTQTDRINEVILNGIRQWIGISVQMTELIFAI